MKEGKDDNGAIKIGAYKSYAKETATDFKGDFDKLVKHDLATLVGDEVIEQVEILTEEPAWSHEIVTHTKFIVMSIEDYDKLADDAWKHRDLQK